MDTVQIRIVGALSPPVLEAFECDAYRETVNEIKARLAPQIGLPPQVIDLAYQARVLDNNKPPVDFLGHVPSRFSAVVRIYHPWNYKLVGNDKPQPDMVQTKLEPILLGGGIPGITFIESSDGLAIDALVTSLEPTSPYFGGQFHFRFIYITDSSWPRVALLTPIHHPQFEPVEGGAVYQLIHKTDSYNLSALCKLLQSLLDNNPLLKSDWKAILEGTEKQQIYIEDRLRQWHENREASERRARHATQLFAKQQWSTAVHYLSPPQLKREVRAVLMASSYDPVSGMPRHPECPFHLLPTELLFMIFSELAWLHLQKYCKSLKPTAA